MKGQLVQSLLNLFPQQYHDTMVGCIMVIGFDKLIKKGYFQNGQPKIQEITEYAERVESAGRLAQIQEPLQIRHELDQLKVEISKLSQQVNNTNINTKAKGAIIHQTPDDRKRSASVGYRQNKPIIQKQREITPKVTQTTPQCVNQIQINIQKHHLDDTEIKSIMRDNYHSIHSKEKPPKPTKHNQSSDNYKRYTDDGPVQVDFEDTDRYPVRDSQVPQQLQYSQLQQSNCSSTDQHQSHNTNQTFAQPQSSQKQLVQSKSMHLQQVVQKSPPHKSPKFKYQSLKQQSTKPNLETVQEESSQSHVKHVSTHSASSKGRQSYRQSQKQSAKNANPQVTSKIKALLDQDKKIYKQQHIMEQTSERLFINPYDKPKQIEDQLIQQPKVRRPYQGSFYKQSLEIEDNKQQQQQQYQQSSQSQSQPTYNQFQGSISMTHQNSNRFGQQFGVSPPKGKFKSQFIDQLSPSSQRIIQQYRPSSLGKQESDLKRSEDFNRSSVSSNFSMFNPNDELKTFFQNDFLERKKYIPQSDLTKQSSASSDHNHHSKYISASQIDDYPKHFQRKEDFSMASQDVEKSNVFQNNRLSVTRILNNSQI